MQYDFCIHQFGSEYDVLTLSCLQHTPFNPSNVDNLCPNQCSIPMTCPLTLTLLQFYLSNSLHLILVNSGLLNNILRKFKVTS